MREKGFHEKGDLIHDIPSRLISLASPWMKK